MAIRTRTQSNRRGGRATTPKVKQLRMHFELTQPKFARVLGVSVRRLASLESGEKPSEPIRRKITEADRLRVALQKLVRDETLGPWMDTPNQAFGGRRPIQVIEDGQIDLLWAMIYDLQSGNPD